MSEFDSPPNSDFSFYKKPKKHGQEWACVPAPEMALKFGAVDTHAHINMLNDPKKALAQAKFSNVMFIEAMTDPLSEEGTDFYDEIKSHVGAPKIRLACGVHPHYAKDYSKEIEEKLVEKLKDELTSALGEVGLDYHYDFSPRNAQIEVFERQIELANQVGLPIILHIREAFDDAYACLKNAGWNKSGVLLHCYTSNEVEIKRWVDAGCYVAFGGALTFKKSDEIRAAAHHVPPERLLTETDSPFMAPMPFRGSECVPSHVLFVAQGLYDELKSDLKVDAQTFFSQLQKNAFDLLDRQDSCL